MKKLLFLMLTFFCVYCAYGATANGTVVNGYFIIQDFDGTAPTFSTTGSTCVLETYPVAGRGLSAKLSVTSNNGYFTIPVTLPTGITLSNNDSLLFDLYHSSGTFKRLRVHLGSTHANSSQAYDFGGNFLGGTVPTNKGTVKVGINQLTGYATAGNSFRLGFGIDYGTTVVYIDNIKLKYTLSTAPTTTAANEITTSGFNANWEALFGVENYRLDVATDAAFTSMVSGYNNLNVGNVLTYPITGLAENTTYYYRVRGAKTNGTSPSSSYITVTTESSGPVELYVAPNLDPVAETDPTPTTIAVPTIFVIDDYESRSINDALLVNNSSNATSSVKANPTNGSQKSAYVRVTNWDGYLRLNVQLPVGKVLSDYAKLSFDEYLQSGYDQNYKDIKVYFGGSEQFSVASGGTTTNAWTTREFSLAGKSAGNTFVLDIGMRTPNGSYFIDNVKLSPAAAPTATTATAATHINATSFKAQWSFFEGSTAYFLDVSTNSGFSSYVSGYENLNVGNVSNYVVSGLIAGTTYYYRVRGTNTSTQSNTITVVTKAGTVAASHFATRGSGNISDFATWQSSANNTGWMSATAAPTSTARSIRVLNGHELTVDDDFDATEIIVRAGGKLNVASGKELTLSGRLFLESSEADGTATFINDGTLSITGDAVVNQYLAAGRNWYFSSPISNATSAVFKATEANQLWERNVPGNSWTEITATNVDLTPLKGYVGKVAANGVVTFSGTLNNANIPTLTLTKSNATGGKFHLVGNPYPSYLDWQAVATANPNLTGSMWFRTKTAVSEEVPTSVYTFSTVLYTTEAGLQIVNGNANTTVTRKIPPMQAFWVRINDGVETANFTVNNTMRYHADETGNKFKAPAVSNRALRLEVSNGMHKDEALLYFNNSASDSYDRFDSPKMFNNIATVPEIYTRSGFEKLVINGMNSFNYDTEIPLGFNAGQTNSYSIRATEMQNFDVDTRVILFDTHTQTEFDLTAGEAYSFSSDAVNDDIRFSIRFKSASGVNSLDDNLSTGLCVYSQQKQLIIQLNTGLSDNAKVTIYNAMGQSIYNQPLHNAVTQLSRTLEAGVYVVKVENGDKSLVVKSLIY
jgi:hypothetical protein